jgi:hypothetical protein
MLRISTDGTTWWPDKVDPVGVISLTQGFTVGSTKTVVPASAPTMSSVSNGGVSKQLTVDWTASTDSGVDSQTTDGNRPMAASGSLSQTITYRVRNSTRAVYLAETTGTIQTETGLASSTSYNYYVSSKNPYISYTNNSASKVGTTKVDLVTVTKSYTCRWSQGYEGDGDKKTDTGDVIYHDYYSSNRGAQRGCFVFDSISIPSDATINWVKLFLHAQHWANSSGGDTTLYIGNVNSGEPATFSGGGALTSTTLSYNGTGDQWNTIPDAFGQYLRGSNGYRMFWVGGSTSTSRYGYFAGESAGSNAPQLQINYTYET